MEKPPMVQQAYSIPALMEEMLPPALAAAEAAAARLGQAEITRVVISGCGDSLAAAYSAAAAFEQMAGLEAWACPVMDLARFAPGWRLAAKGTLYVLVSNSGKVSRIVEAARRIRSLGGRCLAITAEEASPLAQAAGFVLPLHVPSFSPPGPGMRSYCACLLGLFALARALGPLCRAAGAGQNARKAQALWQTELAALPKRLEKLLPTWDTDGGAIAKNLAPGAAFEFVGAGPGYGTALFAQAKLLESGGCVCTLQNTEDWLHMNYFVRPIDTVPTLLFAQQNSPARSREQELLAVALQMGRPVVLLDDAPPAEEKTAPNLHTLPTPALPWWLAPLAQYLPAAMLAAHLGLAWGEEDFRGAAGRFAACQNFATVANSRQVMVDGDTAEETEAGL